MILIDIVAIRKDKNEEGVVDKMDLNQEFAEILEKYENIYIFGVGEVGRRLKQLVDENGFYDKFRGCVVSKRDFKEVEENPVFSLEEFWINMGDSSNVILMSISEAYHPDVYKLINEKETSVKVIDAVKYYSLEMSMEKMDSEKKHFIDIGLDNENELLRDRIIRRYFQKKHAFGEMDFYQSYPPLGIIGLRPTDYRLEKYELMEYLSSEKTVLDIGCNCGFLDMMISQYCQNITALEYDSSMSTFSDMTAKEFGIDNISFVSGDFNQWCKKNDLQFDVVLSFAVHIWIGMTTERYTREIYKLLKNGGILLFESQDYVHDKKYDDFCFEFEKRGLRILGTGNMKDDRINERKYTYFIKE